MSTATQLARRDFLRLTVTASGGLLIGFYFPGFSPHAAAEETGKQFSPNAFVRIGTDERITVVVNHSEMGQGVNTALPMILADELDADWSKVIMVPTPPIDALYGNPGFGHIMHTASSASVTGSLSLRTSGI